MSTTPRQPSAGLAARTPNRRAISADPSSTARRAPVHTPLDRSVTRDLLRSIRRGTPASASRRRSNAPTPHAKAARRALDQRRADLFTPGRNRRESMMEQRETPMDFLRHLAGVLAPKSKPTRSSSSTSASSPPLPSRRASSLPAVAPEDDDNFVDPDDVSSEDRPLKRPRFSLPINEEDDDDDIPPPRVSDIALLDDFTMQSIEMQRRASFAPRLSRGSLGSLPYSEPSDNEDVTGTELDDSYFPGLLDNIMGAGDVDNATLQRIDDDPTRQSDLDIQVPGGGDQTTLILTEPPDDAIPLSPGEEVSTAEAAGDNAVEPQDPPAIADSDPQPAYGDYSSDGNEPLEPMFDPLPPYDGGVSDSDDEQPQDGNETMAEDTNTAAFPISTADKARDALAMQDARTQLQQRKKRKRVSQHGIEYPPLPSAFVKKVAQTALQSSGLSSTRISPDTLVALTQASEWYFEQLGDDLGAYAGHAKRKTIEDSDVATLMRRQRQVGSASTLFSLAQKHLPRELLQELRMPPPQPAKQKRAKRGRPDEDVEVEVTR